MQRLVLLCLSVVTIAYASLANSDTLAQDLNFKREVIRELLVNQVQIQADGANTIENTIIQFRILLFTLVVGIVTLTPRIRSSRAKWAAASTVIVLVSVLWVYDCHYTDLQERRVGLALQLAEKVMEINIMSATQLDSVRVFYGQIGKSENGSRFWMKISHGLKQGLGEKN